MKAVVNTNNFSIAQQMISDEFGSIGTNTNPNFQMIAFAGGMYDPDTGLLRFGARDYDPALGRWMSKDPIRFDGGDANLYAYCKNDPVNCIDPSGLFFESAIASRTTPARQAAIGAAIGAAGAFLMYGSLNPFAPLTFTLGAFLGYEGGKNVLKANDRRFINGIIDGILPPDLDEKLNNEGSIKFCPLN